MIATEAKLWRHMCNEIHFDWTFDRIESPITPGASDVTYVSSEASGWVELKTAKWPRPGKPLRLRCEFSIAQASWLLAHHKPHLKLNSYLLIGILGPTTWARFLLCDAPAALIFMEGRPRVALDQILSSTGVHDFCSISAAITRIRS